MFTILMDKQADIWRHFLEFYYPQGAKVIDFTYGTGATWWATPVQYQITKTDAVPNDESVIKKDLTKDSYADLGLHDAGFFDPPYLIGKNSSYIATSSHRQDNIGKRSWGQNGLARFVANPTLDVFIERLNGLNTAASQTIKSGGLLFVKIMDCRKDGRLITHHITIIQKLTNFELIDLAVYIRQGATTWETKQHLQNLHGYWLIFKMSD